MDVSGRDSCRSLPGWGASKPYYEGASPYDEREGRVVNAAWWSKRATGMDIEGGGGSDGFPPVDHRKRTLPCSGFGTLGYEGGGGEQKCGGRGCQQALGMHDNEGLVPGILLVAEGIYSE
jgi:hypothetical protein